MAQLKKQVKTFITQQLAMFSTPQEVVDLVKENFDGLEVTRQQVFYYDASMNLEIAPTWKAIFDATRKQFLEDVSSIPIANKSFRLKEINTLYFNQKKKSEKLQNPIEMRANLEQAAKEAGDVYTNKRVLTGKDGGAIQVQQSSQDLSKLSTEDLLKLKEIQEKLNAA